LRWTQDGKQTRMSLDGPLGAGGVQLLRTAPLSVSSLHTVTASTTDAARRNSRTDWVSIRHWTVCATGFWACRAGASRQKSLDSQQRLSALQQDGWQIQYTDYMSVAGEWLPSKLTVQPARRPPARGCGWLEFVTDETLWPAPAKLISSARDRSSA